MKPYLLTLAIPAAALLAGCSSPAKSSEAPQGKVVSAPESAAEALAEVPSSAAPIPVEVRKFKREKGDNELEIEYPMTGEPQMLDSIRTWINEQLGDSYRGSLDKPEALFNHYASQLGTDPDLNEYGGYTKDSFELEYSDDYVVTYEHESYEYTGGAHGMGGDYGTTFLRADGSVFDKDCITSYAPLHDLMVEGLKKYFKVKTDEELLACLIGFNSLKRLTPPGTRPWIDKEGVVFAYTPYEIAPYSAGSPRFSVPYDKIAPYLTEKGKRFFGK